MERAGLVRRFGPFEADLRAGELRKNGRRRPLQEKPFRLLEALLEQPGEIVTRDELRQRLWQSDTFVDFDNGLNNSVNKLRAALGDSASDPKFVETVGRRGYRFIGSLEPSPAEPPPPDEAVERPAEPVPVAHWRRLAIGGTVAAVCIVGALLLGTRHRASNTPTIRSLAVLPFQSLSSDPEQAYFSDGMTDAVLTQLAGIRALRVVSRQSTIHLKDTRKSMPELGRELNVDAILEGTVLRTGTRIRVTTQLIHAATDAHLWSDEYQRDLSDVILLQSEIARAIAREIHIALRPEEASRLDASVKVVPGAYDAYLRGRYLWRRRSPDSLKRSLDYFAEAIAIDPRFAMAYAATAEAYGPLGYGGFVPPDESTPRMKAAALRSLELDPNLAEGWTALGACAAFHEWDWRSAEAHFKRALELNASYVTAYMWYGLLFENTGRQEENVNMRRRAVNLEPFNPGAGAALGSALMFAGRLPEAVQQLRSVLELEPSFVQAHTNLGLAHLIAGRFDDAVAEFVNVGRDGSLAHAYAAGGRFDEARAILRELEEASRQHYVSPYEFALAHAGLGDTSRTLDWLERASETRVVKLSMVNVDPRFAMLRGDPRFRSILSRMNLQ